MSRVLNDRDGMVEDSGTTHAYSCPIHALCSLLSLSIFHTMSPPTTRLHVQARRASQYIGSCIDTAGVRMPTLTFRMQEGMVMSMLCSGRSESGLTCPFSSA